MKKLHVECCAWGERWQLGTLADNGQVLLFEYSPAALARGIQFSPLHLPLRAGAFGPFPPHQYQLPGLIADALPDGWGMLLMDRLFRKHGIDLRRLSVLERLAFIGERAIGAFSFQPAQEWQMEAGQGDVLTLAREARNLLAGKEGKHLQELALLGGSPHGARPKVLLYQDAEGQFLPQEAAGSTPWLLKFQAQGEHKEVCAIEMLYADLARACGLEMPATRLLDLDARHAAFAIARFDREDGMRVPLHTLAGLLQHDFRLPSESYVSLLRATRMLTRDVREVQKAFARCVFNVLFHNRDDHSKNFSFRMGRDWRWYLAPCYDLTFSQGPGGEHSMDIAGEGRSPGREQLLHLARAEDINPAWAQACIEQMCAVGADLRAKMEDFPIRHTSKQALLKAVQQNLLRLLAG